MKARAEVDVAAVVVAWLAVRGWDVHQEVETTGGRADILAVNAQGHLWIIEVKTSLTFDLMGQASDQRIAAHYVSVAVPATQRGSTRSRALATTWLREAGIGFLEVMDPGVQERLAPRVTLAGHVAERLDRWYTRTPLLHERAQAITRTRRRLCDETRTFAKAGNNESRYWSDWKETEKAVQRALATIGRPASLKEIAAQINASHRYLRVTERHLYGWFYKGLIDGVARVEGRPLRFEVAA